MSFFRSCLCFTPTAWGFPHAAAITGAKFVFLGPNVDPETILDAIVEHGVTFAARRADDLA